jgi:uncharacterized membrane protein (DUF485 family)
VGGIVAGFAKDLMTVKVVGSLNVGFTLIALNYVLSWILALIYERVANRVFDPSRLEPLLQPKDPRDEHNHAQRNNTTKQRVKL